MTVIQIVLITLIAYWKMTDTVTLQLFAFNTIVCGWLVGLVMGDPATGLYIGATMQLMSMGVVAIGGSSMPDYPVAAIIATAIACSTGRGMEAGLAIGIPVAMLGVNFDVIYKIFNGFLMHKEMSLIENGKFASFLRLVKVSPVFYGLCSALPVFLNTVNVIYNVLGNNISVVFALIHGALFEFLHEPVYGKFGVNRCGVRRSYKLAYDKLIIPDVYFYTLVKLTKGHRPLYVLGIHSVLFVALGNDHRSLRIGGAVKVF